MVEIIEFPGKGKVSDIPAMLRLLADDIERGETAADTAVCIAIHPDVAPILYIWGEHPGDTYLIGTLERMKAVLVRDTG